MRPPIRPRKSWGQHFLIDYNIQRKILDVAEICQGERVIEIGPGRGILTRGLLERGARVIAIEIDPHLTASLQNDLGEGASIEIVQADALHYPYETVMSPYKAVSYTHLTLPTTPYV